MEFVDRVEEQQRLIKTLNSEKPTFIVVYGSANGTCPPNQFVGKRDRSDISVKVNPPMTVLSISSKNGLNRM